MQGGSVIGPYHLLELIGEGGMGEVWLAEQKQPVRRRVAVKLIKTGMDTREVVARFESERQALALMDHPAIAKVFDAGSTPEGRPYFVMEYVAGLPITTYCDRHKLTMRERMELFMTVCEAVQHAHQKAILHRDLKPSNVLVSEVDGKPIPKIIDFGVAKATSQRLSEQTIYTQLGMVIGTLGYISPEQADSAGNDIDTRSDVYSLGVILYELLVGARPLEFNKLAYDESLRRLREQDAPKPSTRLRTLGGDSTTAAHNRGAEVPTLARLLRGDLDAITLKALEKDRKRRYSTPSELASDIGRYLHNQPVIAHAPSTAYRARKYVRRHRVGVALTALAAVLLIAFAIVQTVELRRVRRERDRADRITNFMTDMFKVSDPSKSRGNDIRAREILDKASAQIENGLAQDPEVQAQLMQVMGTVYSNLGLYPQAESLTRHAMESRTRTLGQGNRQTLDSAISLEGILDNESRYQEGEKLARETVDASRKALGPKDRTTIEAERELALILTNESHLPEAEKIEEDALDAARNEFGPKDQLTLSLTENLAINNAYQAKFPAAEKAFREVYETERDTLGPDNPKTLGDMGNLGAILMQENKFSESEAIYRELVDKKLRVLGPEHPTTLLSMGNLALVLSLQKRYPEAEKIFRDTLAIKQRKLGPEHRSTLVTAQQLAEALGKQKKYAEAEQLLRQTVDIEHRTLGPDHSDTLASVKALGDLLTEEGKYSEAEKILLEAYDTSARVRGRDHPDTADIEYSLACIYAMQGMKDKALARLSDAADHGLNPNHDPQMDQDDQLKSLRGDPRFDTIVADVHRRALASKS
jgi:non-specific serine/threonine protein kinase/serine/threonine-protein kinase